MKNQYRARPVTIRPEEPGDLTAADMLSLLAHGRPRHWFGLPASAWGLLIMWLGGTLTLIGFIAWLS